MGQAHTSLKVAKTFRELRATASVALMQILDFTGSGFSLHQNHCQQLHDCSRCWWPSAFDISVCNHFTGDNFSWPVLSNIFGLLFLSFCHNSQKQCQGTRYIHSKQNSVMTVVENNELTQSTACSSRTSSTGSVNHGHRSCRLRTAFRPSPVQSLTIQPQSRVLNGKPPYSTASSHQWYSHLQLQYFTKLWKCVLSSNVKFYSIPYITRHEWQQYQISQIRQQWVQIKHKINILTSCHSDSNNGDYALI